MTFGRRRVLVPGPALRRAARTLAPPSVQRAARLLSTRSRSLMRDVNIPTIYDTHDPVLFGRMMARSRWRRVRSRLTPRLDARILAARHRVWGLRR